MFVHCSTKKGWLRTSVFEDSGEVSGDLQAVIPKIQKGADDVGPAFQAPRALDSSMRVV